MVTDCGANVSSISPSKVSIDLILEVNPEGKTLMLSPFLKIPPLTLPA